ncbi:lipopolysaccharide biosynthesis protein [Pontibacter sp. HSC-14F20]|uniref:lipopolysaccharide biosynthesis protein n=1 Tax=Pontibacter sp. HSC-14F20 TaxID=2864136 RepID=UPI001C72E337|nr:lipopolysaccharide biosynthesis protein [Pontibacter sp. HSC-14F20]MBX0333240.1 lipopolysaccharide biosynthesis protein [Pontibacter sp. HSC-14F20]
MNTNTLKGKVVTGIFWNSVQLIVNRSFSFIIKLILAKILFPEQFGLVGMAAVFTSFIQVFNDLGFGAALVQRREENLREEHFHTSFWTGIVWSIAIYIIIALIVAPLAAEFYEEPIMKQIIPVLSLGVLASPINLVHRAQLTKKLDFKKLTYISNFSSIFSGALSLILALSGFGVWALVFNSVATFIVAMPLYFKATGWLPKAIWEKKAFEEIFGFGLFTTATSIFNNIISKLDYLLIGKMVSASALGIYTLAFILTDTFKSQVMNMVNTVMYPVYGKMQDDPILIKDYYKKVVVYNSIIIYPLMIILIILAGPIIEFIYGDKWLEAILPIKILSASVMFALMVNSHTSMIRGMGKPKTEMYLQLSRAIVLYVPSIFIGTYYYGIVGTAYAVLFNKIAAVFIVQFVLKKLINLSFLELLKALQAPLMGTMLAISSGLVLFNLLEVNFILVGLIMLILYVGTVYIVMKDELQLVYKKLRNKRKIA